MRIQLHDSTETGVDQPLLNPEHARTLTLTHSTCACARSPSSRWCPRADELFGVEGVHVLDVTSRDDNTIVLDVESDTDLAGCPDCGVVAVGHGRRVQMLHDAPCFGRPVRVRWRKRIWRCPEPTCPRSTWTEDHPYAPARAKLTTRATAWAVDALRHDDTTVSAIARHLGVAWGTCWAAISAAARTRLAEPTRLGGIKTIGVDEHIWRPSKIASTDKAVTVMVDLTRGADGCLHARLLDAVQGRSGKVYADWLNDQGIEGVDVKVTVEHAALDPFRGYANAIRDELPEAVAVLDAFHVVKLAGQALDEVRRRIQQAVLGRRGHKDDPLYKVRPTLLTGIEHLTEGHHERLQKYLAVGDPNGEVEITWQLYQQVPDRSTTPRHQQRAERSPRRSSTPSTPARSARSSASAEPCGAGGPRSWPTSPPAASRTAAPRRSTASSKRPDASPTASATSPSTASGSCSPPTAHAPTNAARGPRPNHAELRRAGKRVGFATPAN